MKLDRVVCSRNLVLTLLFSCLPAYSRAPEPRQGAAIKAIGCFANVRSDGEHADGYSLQLWLRGKEVIGLIDYHRGLPGDPPMGMLTDVRYESATGKLSFQAKLTSGLHSCRIHKNVPSHDLLTFQGFLKADRVEGNIRIEDQLDSPPAVTDTRENFPLRKRNDCLPENFADYDAWWRRWDPVHKARGASW